MKLLFKKLLYESSSIIFGWKGSFLFSFSLWFLAERNEQVCGTVKENDFV